MAVDYSKYRAPKEVIETFHTAPFDKAGARQKMKARIERTLKQLNGEKVGPQGGKDFETLYNEGVIYRPTLNGVRLEVFETEDEDGFHATRDNLKAMLKEFGKDVDAGTFDDALRAALEATPNPEPAAKTSTSGRGGAGRMRKSSLPARADGIEHRVLASEEQPHKDYTLNKAKTYWRSPEQVMDDDKRSAQRQATIKSK